MDYLSIKRALESFNSLGNNTILFAEARVSEKWNEIRTSPYYRDMVDDIRAEANKLLSKPIEALPYSCYKQFDTNGSRIEFERQYFDHRKRLSIVAFLSLLDNNPLYIEALEDTIWAICDEYTWCLPAHLGGNSLKFSGKQHRLAIDLFAAETAFALAEIIALLKAKLSDIVVHRAEYEVRERVLKVYCMLGSSFHWETLGNNWASVCGGSIGAAALYLIPSASELSPIIHRILGTMQCYINGFGDDGVSTEGVGYWTYGFGFYMYFANLLKQRTAGMIDLMENEKVRQIALFHQKCYLTGRQTVPFSDCETTHKYSLGIIHALKHRYPEIHVPDVANRFTITEDPIGRWAPFVRDFIWSSTDWMGGEWPDASYYLPDAQWFINRMTVGGMQFSFAAKGGNNDEPHNHNDLGSFVLHIGGETLLSDLGSGEYTKGYFGVERYSYLCNGSQGHSVPIVEGIYQHEGARFKAKIQQMESDECQDKLSIDITMAYNIPNLQVLIREFTLRKERAPVLEMKDTFVFHDTPSSLIDRFITLYKPICGDDGDIRIQGERSGVKVIYDHSMWQPIIQCFDFVNKGSELVNVYTVDLELRQPVKECVMNVRFESYLLH